MSSAPAKTAAANRLRDLSEKATDVFHFRPANVQVLTGWNERQKFTGIEELGRSIHRNGQKQAGIVRKNGDAIELIAGERRLRACLWIVENLDPDWLFAAKSEDRNATPLDNLFTQLEENSGVPFTLLEKARIYAKARDMQATQQEIADRSQTTKQAVSQALVLVDHGAPIILSFIEQDKLSATMARTIIERHRDDHAAQIAEAEAAIANAAIEGKTTATPKHLEKPVTNPEKETVIIPDPEGPASDEPVAPSAAPLFRLYRQDGAPRECLADGTIHETYRLVLENPTHGIQRLHLLFIEDGTYYGWRINDHEQLPDTHNDLTAFEVKETGLAIALAYAMAHFGSEAESRIIALSPPLEEALDRYWPTTAAGIAEEPRIIDYVATADPSALQRFKDATPTNRDGTTPGAGNHGGFASCDKRITELDSMLETLSEEGHPDRLITAYLIHSFIISESSPATLKNHLKGKD